MPPEMRKSKIKHAFAPVPALVCLCMALASRPAQALDADAFRKSVVKIHVTAQRYDYFQPWQAGRIGKGKGTGFAIGKRRILTNAHIVSNTRFLQVQKDGDPRLYRARVTYIAHDCDLATLTVDEEEFFENATPLKFAAETPDLDDEVTVLGYPLGGSRLSVTRGVVSRIDYASYAHSGADQHLVLQVDAAINPGNSGGPILFDGKVVGLAFQGLSLAENIGYAIPLPVIEHFLEDIEDSAYHGYPELGVGFMDTRNGALRADLAIPANRSGVAVTRIDPFGSAAGLVQPGDVLLAIDKHAIKDDGTISLNGNVVIFPEILERKQWGQAIDLTVWRDGSVIDLEVPLTNPYDPFVFRNLYDTRPRYYLYGGLVFSPLAREHLKGFGKDSKSLNVRQLFYYAQYAKIDGLHEGLNEFVVLVNRLPHSVNTYARSFERGIVTSINDVEIKSLMDVKIAIERRKTGYHVLRFAGMDESLVLDAEAVNRANREIMESYDVSSEECLTDLVPSFEGLRPR